MTLQQLTLRAGNPMGKVLLAVLSFEVIAFGLAIPVMIFVSGHPANLAAFTGGGAAFLALVSAGLLRKPVGYVLGWITQLAGFALGLVTPAMFIVGLLFLGLWIMSFVLGRRLDAARRDDAGRADKVSP